MSRRTPKMVRSLKDDDNPHFDRTRYHGTADYEYLISSSVLGSTEREGGTLGGNLPCGT